MLGGTNQIDKAIRLKYNISLQLGHGFQRVVYIGDAEWDMQATKTLGWHFIGIGARLKGKCEYWVEDFSSYNTFMKMLHA